ncbi:MAG: hypothetical protein JSW35_05625 [Deltaproteobacteria bacterium]|nr:MAG: hypothetical protein JSW35_05625 [Deltaproteobacteria bacterium]
MKETRENCIPLGRCIRNYYAIFKLKEKVNRDLITSAKITLTNLFKLEYIGAFSYTALKLSPQHWISTTYRS